MYQATDKMSQQREPGRAAIIPRALVQAAVIIGASTTSLTIRLRTAAQGSIAIKKETDMMHALLMKKGEYPLKSMITRRWQKNEIRSRQILSGESASPLVGVLRGRSTTGRIQAALKITILAIAMAGGMSMGAVSSAMVGVMAGAMNVVTNIVMNISMNSAMAGAMNSAMSRAGRSLSLEDGPGGLLRLLSV
ncbi:hypothetical protein F4604DRAFT_1676404 [Suillus subluteus]|nr:hypothetical protein F4604DRAFT_1676404 [Suillus subluteus]